MERWIDSDSDGQVTDKAVDSALEPDSEEFTRLAEPFGPGLARPSRLPPAERPPALFLAACESQERTCQYVRGEGRAGNAIEKLVSRLRNKVDREEPSLIHTRRGFGYWLGG